MRTDCSKSYDNIQEIVKYLHKRRLKKNPNKTSNTQKRHRHTTNRQSFLHTRILELWYFARIKNNLNNSFDTIAT